MRGMIRTIAQVFDILGEGPSWSAREGRLYWLDIKGRRLHWHAPGAADLGEMSLPVRASVAVPREAGGLLLVTEAGLAFCDPDSEAFDIVRPMTFPEGFRTNDGKLDLQGRLWWSTMDDDGGARPGSLFRTEPDLATTLVLEGVHIANTVTVTADGRTLLLADSRLRTIFACDTADLTRRRVFARTEGDIAPDGSTLDAEGFLWNAQWGGARLTRYAPDGSIDRIVDMPVSQPTSCAFGGPGLRTLYVTSAREGLSAGRLEREPLAGSLFAFEPGVPGLPAPAFAG